MAKRGHLAGLRCVVWTIMLDRCVVPCLTVINEKVALECMACIFYAIVMHTIQLNKVLKSKIPIPTEIPLKWLSCLNSWLIKITSQITAIVASRASNRIWYTKPHAPFWSKYRPHDSESPVAQARRNPCLLPGWKTLSTRIGYSSNTNWAHRFQCKDNNASFMHVMWENEVSDR